MLTKSAHKNGVEVPYGNSVLLDFSENAPESRRLGKAFRLGAYSTPLEKYVVQAHGPRMPTTNARHAALGRGGTTHAAMKVIGCSCNNTLGNIKMTYQRRFGWSN